LLVPILNVDHELILKPYEEIHHLKTIQWLNSDWLKSTFGIGADLSLERHQQWLSDNKDILIWTINFKNKYVGNILLKPNYQNLSAYMQIYIGETQFLSKGIGSRSLKAVFDYVFSTALLNRIWLHCFLHNEKAMDLYKKLGFMYEGEEREALYRGGKFISQVRMSLLRKDWFKL
jgi:RimJ/RimL family protein N-acetyltransferase